MNIIEIPKAIFATANSHFFQSDLEQGAFMFANAHVDADEMRLVVDAIYLVPKSGWERQSEVYLQMRDSERAKIMKLARERGACAIDCHSHPQSGADVWFSPSDVHGISEFAPYAKWKLGGRPFAAIVFGEESLDAVAWKGDFTEAQRVDAVRVLGTETKVLRPNCSWFRRPRAKHRFDYGSYESF